ncbi:histidine-phosphotransfer domain, HPT domain-containing protein [Nadsonia fulvescens var. elongata DSM 6958]|uniref:Histidine-phosphotransfer domain, HPT domain-containing protein n=1 Tax=Nadsonia fulvescens var. elongata DSM 6958 TaxID=857566 RepID=A0A1E3PST0_9ASCO|nr:histidine-phosphotransfer domain, HPT domain-containing protein [Nadsonia fulvescens var. elongata DSM 6958]
MDLASTISPEDFLDWTTFEQILEMDEDETEREFSKSIVENFYEQAESTFVEMETALENRDLNQLSSLGHFLKGSSAALGLTKVQNSCEKIQHLGANMDESGTMEMNNNELCLEKIQTTIEAVKEDYAISRSYLEHYFNSL